MVLQQVLALPALEQSTTRASVFDRRMHASLRETLTPIQDRSPGDRALLDVDMTPRRSLRMISKDLGHLVHPSHVQLFRKVDPD